MNTAKPIPKVVSLRVRPFQAAHLCFEVGGILGESDIELGAPVAAFDFNAFYTTLSSFPTLRSLTGHGTTSRLFYEPPQIRGVARPFALVALRAEAQQAALNKAINARENAYVAKYGNIDAISSRTTFDYSPNFFGTSKPERLATLSKISQQQADLLIAAYNSEGRTGVVKTTSSVLDSILKSSGTSRTTGHKGGHRDDKSDEKTAEWITPDATFPPPPPGTRIDVVNTDIGVKEDFKEGFSSEDSSEDSSENSESTGSANQFQTILNTDYGYRIPFLESQAQNERAQISLIDEQFAQFMSGLSLQNQNLGRILQNELDSIDNDVFKLQIAYLNTILMSPISGTVTGIYKNLGEVVRAGETVLRVENNTDVLLVATLIFRGPISIGSSVTVETTLFDSSGPPTKVGGPVVAVRGQQEDDHWEVIVKCNNLDSGGNPIFPLGYHFDFDDTNVAIT